MTTRRFVIFLLVVALVISAGFAYLRYLKTQKQGPESLLYNSTLGEWETVTESPRIELKEIDPDPNEDGLHNRTLVRGVLDHFNLDTHEVTLKMALPFTGESQYQLATFKLAPEQTIYCSPSIITDQITGKVHQTKDLGFIVKNGQTMFISQEKNILFNEVVERANQTTYVFLQLTNDYQEDTTNYIQKMVVVGLCD